MILAEAYKSLSADTSTPSKALDSSGPPRHIKEESFRLAPAAATNTYTHGHKHRRCAHTWAEQMPELTQSDLPLATRTHTNTLPCANTHSLIRAMLICVFVRARTRRIRSRAPRLKPRSAAHLPLVKEQKREKKKLTKYCYRGTGGLIRRVICHRQIHMSLSFSDSPHTLFWGAVGLKKI